MPGEPGQCDQAHLQDMLDSAQLRLDFAGGLNTGRARVRPLLMITIDGIRPLAINKQ
jgi:hypothetical protein